VGAEAEAAVAGAEEAARSLRGDAVAILVVFYMIFSRFLYIAASRSAATDSKFLLDFRVI
jgi:hypothetical protein